MKQVDSMNGQQDADIAVSAELHAAEAQPILHTAFKSETRRHAKFDDARYNAGVSRIYSNMLEEPLPDAMQSLMDRMAQNKK